MLDYVINWPCRKGGVLHENLGLLHGNMPELYCVMRSIARVYGHQISCYQMIRELMKSDPMEFKNRNFYPYIIHQFVSAIGFGGLNEKILWDGREHFDGHVISLVFRDVTLEYSVLQRKEAEQFLLHALYISG